MLMILLTWLVSTAHPCDHTPTDLSNRQRRICAQVAKRAAKAKIDPVLAVAVAYHETKFAYKRGAAGEIGPLQAMPKYWCPQKKEHRCDAVAAGLKALDFYLKHNKTLRKALTRYNGKGARARAYATAVLEVRQQIKNKTAVFSASALTNGMYAL